MPMDNDFFPQFSRKEFERRHQLVRSAMKEKKLDCLVIYGAYSYAGTDSGQVNLVYLSNYAGINHSYLVFPSNESPTLFICHALHVPNARDISVIEDVRAGGMDLIEALGQRLQELGLQKGSIGIVGPLPSWWSHTLPVEHDHYLKQLFPQAAFQVVSQWYENLRLVKSEEEIKLLEKAGALTDLAFEELFLATRPGVKHSGLRRLIEGVANRFGGKYPFSHVSSTPMANPQQYYPDFYPTQRTIEAGHVVMTELTLGYGLYFGKMWGTYFVGEPTAEYLRMFELAASVHDQAIQTLKPGMKGRDVNEWVEPFRKAGFVQVLSLVNGWSTYNHAPHAGALEGTAAAKRLKPADLDFVFQEGHCIGINSFPVSPDMKKGVWVGTACVMTKKGLKKFHAYPVNKVRIVPI
jgi:creatinase